METRTRLKIAVPIADPHGIAVLLNCSEQFLDGHGGGAERLLRHLDDVINDLWEGGGVGQISRRGPLQPKADQAERHLLNSVHAVAAFDLLHATHEMRRGCADGGLDLNACTSQLEVACNFPIALPRLEHLGQSLESRGSNKRAKNHHLAAQPEQDLISHQEFRDGQVDQRLDTTKRLPKVHTGPVSDQLGGKEGGDLLKVGRCGEKDPVGLKGLAIRPEPPLELERIADLGEPWK